MSSGFINSMNLGLSKAERQKNLDAKKAKNEKIVRLHVAGAFTVGFCPPPFSDMPLLLANQVALVDNVLSIYQRDELKELLSILLGEVGLGVVVSHFAIHSATYLTAQLLKILPGLGSIAGGLINRTIASSVTYSYGLAISSFCYRKCKAAIYKGIDSSVNDEDIKNFTHVFRQAFDEFSSINQKTEFAYE